MAAAAHDHAAAAIRAVFRGRETVPLGISSILCLHFVFHRSQAAFNIQAVYIGPAALIAFQKLFHHGNDQDLIVTLGQCDLDFLSIVDPVALAPKFCLVGILTVYKEGCIGRRLHVLVVAVFFSIGMVTQGNGILSRFRRIYRPFHIGGIAQVNTLLQVGIGNVMCRITAAYLHTAACVTIVFRLCIGIPGGIEGILCLHRHKNRLFFLLPGRQTAVNVQAVGICPTPIIGIYYILYQGDGDDLIIALFQGNRHRCRIIDPAIFTVESSLIRGLSVDKEGHIDLVGKLAAVGAADFNVGTHGNIIIAAFRGIHRPLNIGGIAQVNAFLQVGIVYIPAGITAAYLHTAACVTIVFRGAVTVPDCIVCVLCLDLLHPGSICRNRQPRKNHRQAQQDCQKTFSEFSHRQFSFLSIHCHPR